MSVRIEPLMPAAVFEAAEFLSEHLNGRVSPSAWASALDVTWSTPQPNHGFILRDDNAVVGALLAFYSDRVIRGRTERFCNLGAWCVLPDYRFQSVRLLRSALGQEGYTFTDLSPSGPVVPLNLRLGFTMLDTTSVLIPCLPHPSLGRTRVVTSVADIRAPLTATERRVFDDHRDAPAVHHALLKRAEGHCHVIYRRDRRRGLPLFASVLYASNPPLFAKSALAFGSHVALRHRLPAVLLETRVAKPPRAAIKLKQGRPKMFRSDTVTPEQIDNLYSELCCVAW